MLPEGSLVDKLKDAVLVVAHPDDEILWFSSIVFRVARVIVCYLEVPGQPEWSRGRKDVIGEFPLLNTSFLGLIESVAFKQANWKDPNLSPYGMELDAGSDSSPLTGFSAARYRANHAKLVDRLRSELAGVACVLTHNPWGEYGHEEHVQVYRAVTDLQASQGFEVWFDNYASDRSAALMARTLARTSHAHESFCTQAERVAPIEALYRKHGCWTWPYDDYRFFERESFILDQPLLPQHKPMHTTMPINFLSVDFSALQTPKRSLLRRVQRRLRKLATLSD